MGQNTGPSQKILRRPPSWEYGSGGGIAAPIPWRGGRVVDGSGLENQRSESFRGFESRPLRSSCISKYQPRKSLPGWSGISPEGGCMDELQQQAPRRRG